MLFLTLAKYFFRWALRFLEFQNSRVMKSSYETKLRKVTSHFELLPPKCLIEILFSSY